MRGVFAALVALSLVLPACGRTAEHWTEIGDQHLRDGRYSEAELAYSRAIERDPHHAPAIYGKGWALYVSGHESLQGPARQLFQRAIDYDPEFYGGYRGKGVMLMADGKPLAAERFLREAFARAPEEPSVLESLGQLYLRARRLDEAEQVFRAAVELAPARGELRRGLAEVALARGDHEEALNEVELGRGGSVSGELALLSLDEGEAMIFLDRARGLLNKVEGPGDPRLDAALQDLARASTVLDEASRRGFEDEVAPIREELLEPLSRKAVEAGAQL